MTQRIFAKEPLGGHWNGAQRLVAVIGVIAFVLASVVPPWTLPPQTGKHRAWGLLFDAPAAATEIDWLILVFEWFVVFVATIILVWVFRGRSAGEHS